MFDDKLDLGQGLLYHRTCKPDFLCSCYVHKEEVRQNILSIKTLKKINS